MLLKPRDYQDFGINSVFQYFEEKAGNPLLLYPTGTGKSIIVAGICVRALSAYPQTRIMMLTKTKELVKQNYEKLKMAWTDAPVGIYCDGLGFKQHHYPITFASIASVFRIGELFDFIDFVIIDEAHEISPADETMYRKLFAALQKRNPRIKFIGLTATGYRMKQGKLTDGENALFTDIVVDCTTLDAFNWFFDEGYLVPPIPRPTKTQYDLSKVAIKGGEYDQKSLHEEVDNAKKNEAAVLEMLEWGQTRHSGLVFCSGVEHCKHILEIFKYYGQDATWVASKGMSDTERDNNIAAYKDNQFKWMINNGILTTGFDKTDVDFIGMLRHTLSPGLWVQMLGRGTRPHFAPGYDLTTKEGRLAAIANSIKQNTLVLDFAENVTRLGPINDPRVPKPAERKRAGDAPVRICDGCGCYNHASATQCWNCGMIFPRMLKIGESSAKPLVKLNKLPPELTMPEYREREVDRVVYMIWRKPDKPDSIKVMYHCGVHMHNEWICLEHGGFAARKAREWWRARSETTCPETTAEAFALKDGLKQPQKIKVVVNNVSGEIVDYIF